MRNGLKRFLRYLQVEKGFSQGTIEAYRGDVGKGLIPVLQRRGIFEAGDVTRAHIRAFMEYQATDRGNSNTARARKLAAIKSFFNYLVENEGLPVNPAAAVRSPRIPETEPVYLTGEESIRLLTTIDRAARPQVRERDLAIVVLFLQAGLRVSELTGLETVNVDLELGQIKINRKGNKEQYLHINAQTVEVMADYLAHRPQGRNGYFFVGANGGNLNRAHIYGVVRGYLSLAGIDKGKYGPHLLRHTFCTRLHQKGVAPFVIMELAGHKSLNTTMRYVNIENKEQSQAIDRLEIKGSWNKRASPGTARSP